MVLHFNKIETDRVLLKLVVSLRHCLPQERYRAQSRCVTITAAPCTNCLREHPRPLSNSISRAECSDRSRSPTVVRCLKQLRNELSPGTTGDKCKSRRNNLRLCNKKRGEENEKDILKLSTYIITSICEKYKCIFFKNI